MEGWQPIATAPKDPMRCILLAWGGQTQPGCWNDTVNNWQEWPDGDFAFPDEVTHWQPLPKAPPYARRSYMDSIGKRSP